MGGLACSPFGRALLGSVCVSHVVVLARLMTEPKPNPHPPQISSLKVDWTHALALSHHIGRRYLCVALSHHYATLPVLCSPALFARMPVVFTWTHAKMNMHVRAKADPHDADITQEFLHVCIATACFCATSASIE